MREFGERDKKRRRESKRDIALTTHRVFVDIIRHPTGSVWINVEN